MSIQVVTYNKDFKEISNDTYYSEDDLGEYIDSLPTLREPSLNNEVSWMLNDMISFVKPKTRKVIN